MPFTSAISARTTLFDPRHESAFRLFNGFTEGDPDLVMEIYGRTLVVHNYAEHPTDALPRIESAVQEVREHLPWLDSGLLKTRHTEDQAAQRGMLLFGQKLAHKIREAGVWYALDLQLNRDASFYLDTRAVREWAKQNLVGKTVLNTFAYTGSLGVAAMAGGATRVVQTDRNKNFLNIAKTSYTLNGFPIRKGDFSTEDFFAHIAQLKRAGALFDCVFVDPPFFSTTAKGTVDLVHQSERVFNKVRPLIADGGWLVAINNALFVSGEAYLQTLNALCADGYLEIETFLSVPDDCVGAVTNLAAFPTNPAPFNHPTKIAVLRVKRKDRRQTNDDGRPQ